jgi:hypothetical protein
LLSAKGRASDDAQFRADIGLGYFARA